MKKLTGETMVLMNTAQISAGPEIQQPRWVFISELSYICDVSRVNPEISTSPMEAASSRVRKRRRA